MSDVIWRGLGGSFESHAAFECLMPLVSGLVGCSDAHVAPLVAYV